MRKIEDKNKEKLEKRENKNKKEKTYLKIVNLKRELP